MRKWRADFKATQSNDESYYDLIEDWELIDASFTQQYGIRLTIDDMDWYEFQTKLQMLNDKTPLGQMVYIRSEKDPEVLKHFTKEQMRIRKEYMKKQAQSITKDSDKYKAAMQDFKSMFSAFKSMSKKS